MQKIIAKIHLGNIRRNAERFSALTGKRLCAVVKANAYGHGAEEVVNALEGVADCFAVALISEAVAIRAAACGRDILVFTPPLDETEAAAMVVNGFVATVPDLWTARLLSQTCAKQRLPIRVHLKINTGMNRYGMNASMLGKVCKFLRDDPFVRVEGAYTHLYEYTFSRAAEQNDLFLRVLAVCRRYFPNVTTHLGGTYAALLGQDFAFDMTRVGIGLYGYLPDGAEDVTQETLSALKLEKGMTVYGRAVTSRKISYGGVGYGKARTAEELNALRKLTVCRFGYADGFLRQKRNGVCGFEENANHTCMDVCLRKGEKRRGEWFPILTDAAETARLTGTISYEVLCAATRRAEFVYDNE